MPEIFKLNNKIKRYDWGSPDFIPGLLGFESDGGPWAELWMGSHPGSPSAAVLPSGEISLGELIAGDPRRFLGKKAAEQYGVLPFLFKLLAAGKPLSVQAHPNKAQAREGFDRENRAGLAADAPDRCYRDSNHKPEIICALTPFTGMCGFRNPVEIRRLLEAFLNNDPRSPVPSPQSPSSIVREGFTPLLQALEIPDTAAALRNFLSALFGLTLEVRQALTEYILSADPLITDHYSLITNFAQQYPGDPAVIAPLYLNVFRLEPGEAVFLDAGVLHAYIHGFGVELMANSDNVLRGGLTPKHVDVGELMKVLEFSPYNPHIMKPSTGSSSFTYPTPCEEFSLAVMQRGTSVLSGPRCGLHGDGDGDVTFTPNGPAVCIVTDGEVSVSGGMILKKGESAFIPADSGPLALQGKFTLYAASLGKRNNE
jgi:mannose-6-phosphate isomerase